MSFRRWRDEFLHPEKKCERVGHNEIEVTRTGYMKPYRWTDLTGRHPYRSVAVRFQSTAKKCARCDASLGGEVEYKQIDNLQGLSLPQHESDKFEADGVLWD